MNEIENKPGWWKRNWKWVVPTGCMTTIGLCGGLIAIFVFAVFGVIRSTDVYQEALKRAQNSDAVAQALGNPIQDGTLVTGNVSTGGTTGHANLAIPISGPKGTGTIYVVASKAQGTWKFQTLKVKVDQTGESIDLLEEK